MSTYFMSDIHGEYELFCELLSKIAFCSSDRMIILGDIIDKGQQSKKLLKLVMETPNVCAILGNHEYFFLQYYKSKMQEARDGDDYESILLDVDGYLQTENQPLTWEMLDYVESLPMYIEEEDFICVHAGLQLDAEKRIIPLNKQREKYFIFDRRFAEASVQPQNSKTVLFGHTPCNYQNGSGEFIKTLRSGAVQPNSACLLDYSKIRLDTGVLITHMLGCLRLDGMRETYVKARKLY